MSAIESPGTPKPSAWEAKIWFNNGRWHAQYVNGPGMITDGGALWIDHACTQEKIEKKAATMLRRLNPEPVDSYTFKDAS